MLELLKYILVFLIAFFILIKSADKFVDEASTIGKKLGMSKLTIGLTIVAIGTSLPEMITSLASIFFTENYSDFVIGTPMESNITNS
jgi:cation:H+ antiporter